MKIALIIIGLLIVFLIIFFSSMAKGEKAIEKMTEEERMFFEEKVQSIPSNPSYKDIVSILGKPDRGENSFRPAWKVLENKSSNQIAVYLNQDSTVRKIRWMKLGKFVWEKEF